jgi:hypothetical protein
MGLPSFPEDHQRVLVSAYELRPFAMERGHVHAISGLCRETESLARYLRTVGN